MSDLMQAFHYMPLRDLSLLTFLIGACVGSYMNVVAYRVPLVIQRQLIEGSLEVLQIFNIKVDQGSADEKLSDYECLSNSRSYCPNCKKPIPFYYNIPILSWLILKGKSSCCSQKISPRYVIIELVFALFFSASFYLFDFISALSLSFSFTILYAISSIDLKIEIIPDSLVHVFLAAGLFYSGTNYESSFFYHLTFVYGTYFSIYVLNEICLMLKGVDGIGMGDAKLLAASTAWLGIYGGCYVFIFSPLLFAFFCFFYKKGKMAFGPAISIMTICLMIASIGFNISLEPTFLY